MKRTLIIISLLFFTLCSYAQPALNALKDAERMVNAFAKGDFNIFVKYSHPVIVRSFGGHQKMVAFLQNGIKEMKLEGNTVKKISVGKVSKIYKGSYDLQCTIPQILVMGVKGGTLTTRTSLIGFSNDQGKTWTFADSGGKTPAQLKAILPTYNMQVVLEKPSKPVFTSE